jgi:MYXO-CTERM domain-containing protein
VTLYDTAPITPFAGTEAGPTVTVTNFYTVPDVANRALVVAYSGRGSGNEPTATGVAFGGLAMTKAEGFTQEEGTFRAAAELWYLLNPPTGAGDLVIDRVSGDNGYVVGGVTLGDVHPTTPIGQTGTDGSLDNGTPEVISATLSNLTAGSMILSVSGSNYAGSNNPGTDIATVLFGNITGGANRASAGANPVTSETEMTLTYEFQGTSNWRGAMTAVEFVQIPEPASGVLALLGLATLVSIARRRT